MNTTLFASSYLSLMVLFLALSFSVSASHLPPTRRKGSFSSVDCAEKDERVGKEPGQHAGLPVCICVDRSGGEGSRRTESQGAQKESQGAQKESQGAQKESQGAQSDQQQGRFSEVKPAVAGPSKQESNSVNPNLHSYDPNLRSYGPQFNSAAGPQTASPSRRDMPGNVPSANHIPFTARSRAFSRERRRLLGSWMVPNRMVPNPLCRMASVNIELQRDVRIRREETHIEDDDPAENWGRIPSEVSYHENDGKGLFDGGAAWDQFADDNPLGFDFGNEAHVRAALTPSSSWTTGRFSGSSASSGNASAGSGSEHAPFGVSNPTSGRLAVAVRPLMCDWSTREGSDRLRRMLRGAANLVSGSLGAAPSSVGFKMNLFRLFSPGLDFPGRDSYHLGQLEVSLGTFRDTGPLSARGHLVHVPHMLVAALPPPNGRSHTLTFLIVLMKEANVHAWLRGEQDPAVQNDRFPVELASGQGSASCVGSATTASEATSASEGTTASESKLVPFYCWVVKISVLSSTEKLGLGRPIIAFESSRSAENWFLQAQILPPQMLDISRPRDSNRERCKVCDVVGFRGGSMSAFQIQEASSEGSEALTWSEYFSRFCALVGTIRLDHSAGIGQSGTVFAIRIHRAAHEPPAVVQTARSYDDMNERPVYFPAFFQDVEILSPDSMNERATGSQLPGSSSFFLEQSSEYYTLVLKVHSSALPVDLFNTGSSQPEYLKSGPSCIHVYRLATRHGQVLGVGLIVNSLPVVRLGSTNTDSPTVGWVVML